LKTKDDKSQEHNANQCVLSPPLRSNPVAGILLAVEGLSAHLFWDVKASEVDAEKHAAWLVRRVLEYGEWSDWQALAGYYGKQRMGEIACTIRSMRPRSFAFCRAWFQLPASAFRCSTTTPFP